MTVISGDLGLVACPLLASVADVAAGVRRLWGTRERALAGALWDGSACAQARSPLGVVGTNQRHGLGALHGSGPLAREGWRWGWRLASWSRLSGRARLQAETAVSLRAAER